MDNLSVSNDPRLEEDKSLHGDESASFEKIKAFETDSNCDQSQTANKDETMQSQDDLKSSMKSSIIFPFELSKQSTKKFVPKYIGLSPGSHNRHRGTAIFGQGTPCINLMFKNKGEKNEPMEMASHIKNLTLSRPSFTENFRSTGMPRRSKRKSEIQSLISVGDIIENNFDGIQETKPLEQIDEEKVNNFMFQIENESNSTSKLFYSSVEIKMKKSKNVIKPVYKSQIGIYQK